MGGGVEGGNSNHEVTVTMSPSTGPDKLIEGLASNCIYLHLSDIYQSAMLINLTVLNILSVTGACLLLYRQLFNCVCCQVLVSNDAYTKSSCICACVFLL